MWPFTTQKRETASYTDALIAHLQAAASGAVATPEAVAATETSAGTWARALASADVTPLGRAADACTPELLGMIGRALVRRGEWVAAIDVDRDGRIVLVPASAHSIDGEPSPSTWRYELTLSGPSGTRTVTRPGEGIVHIRYGVEPARPWRGLSPLQFAYATGKLSAGLERGMGEEASGATAYVLPMPDNPDATKYDTLREDLRTAKGKTVFAETTSAGMGDGRAAAPQSDWQARRIGINAPAANVSLRADVEACILAIHGISPSLSQANSDGTAQREAWRRLVFGTIEPISRIIARELADKLESPGLRFTFDALRANDLAGQARAFRGLVGREGSMDTARAEAIVRFEA